MKRIKLKRKERDYYIKVLLSEVTLGELMTSPAISVKMDAHFSDVATKFKQHGIRHLPVVDKQNKVVGIVTERDLHKICSPRKLEDGTWYYDKDMLDGFVLSTVMTPNPVTMHSEQSIAEALLRMAQNKYGCIPIVDKQGVLCGVVTQMDYLYVAAQILEEV